ncbi:MAG: SurA N-terminal domain-containing protein [Terriglobales bacterium]|jgi:sulfur carrier protein ThiS|nr:SurA N-terminal domain-containing protein [Terriglobales bacterium]
MNSRLSITVVALALTTSTLLAHTGQVLDRIVATVNGQIILQSDWEDAIRYEAFIANRPVDMRSAADRKAALDRLIDQELLREQMRGPDALQPTEQQVESQIQQIRKQYDAQNDPQWKALLAVHQLTEDELQRRVTLQLELSRLVDAHLRPSANITSKSIESYYQQELLPQLHQSGAKEVPLAEVSPKIKELLTQQKITELLVTWLENLRAGSEIHIEPYLSSNDSLNE